MVMGGDGCFCFVLFCASAHAMVGVSGKSESKCAMKRVLL